MPEDYIVSPRDTFEPGDVFANIPFPKIKAPTSRYRRKKESPKGNAEYYCLGSTDKEKPGDLLHTNFQLKTVMLLSHGCELDKVLKEGATPDRRDWLCAPISEVDPALTGKTEEQDRARAERIREGRQPNRFFLGYSPFIAGENCVDLRRITPLPATYFIEAKKIFSLSQDALDDLYSALGVNFSGLALYLTPISCPHCSQEIDPREFIAESEDEQDTDYD